jgi:hypothetical protein
LFKLSWTQFPRLLSPGKGLSLIVSARLAHLGDNAKWLDENIAAERLCVCVVYRGIVFGLVVEAQLSAWHDLYRRH